MKRLSIAALLFFMAFSVLGQEKSTYTYAVKDGDSLKLDVYIPQNATSSQKFPAVIWMHGGGFAGGRRDVGDELKLMNYLSSNGYVGISISYRLLRKGKKTGFGCDCSKDEKLNVFKQAALDYLEASKFVFERHSEFKIDKNKIIAGGSSAGAESVLNAVYMTSYFMENPEEFDSVKFAGVMSLAGALVNINYLTEENALPTVLFHGTADNLVPYASAPHHYCTPNKPGYLMLDGSETIVKKLRELGKSYYFHTEIDGHHGLSSIPFESLDAVMGFFEKTMGQTNTFQSTFTIQPKKQ